MERKIRIANVAGILIACVASSCTLDENIPAPSLMPLTLTVNQNLSLTELSWNTVKVTGFKEYIILHSSSEIPDSPEPVTNANVAVIKRIDDADITSVKSSISLFTPRTCYKIYASVNDRFIQSSNVCVDNDFTLIDGFYDRAAHLDGSDELVLFDRVDQRFTVYNYKNETVSHQIENVGLSFPILSLQEYQGTFNLFAYDQSPPRMRKYPFPSLSSSVHKDFTGVLFAVNFADPFILAATEEFGKGFQVIHRNTMSVIDSKPGFSGNRNIAVFEGTPTTALEISDFGINKYSMDSNGKLILLDTKPNGIQQLNTQNTNANSSEYYVAGRFGNIVDRNGDIVGALHSNPNEVVVMSRFSEDEKKLAYIINNFAGFRLEIVDASNINSLTNLSTYDLPNSNFAELFIEEEIVYVVGVSFDSGFARTFILKFPLN